MPGADRRCRGLAGAVLDFVCRDMASRGVGTLYLLTDHTGFYERYGWEYDCLALGTVRKRRRGCMRIAYKIERPEHSGLHFCVEALTETVELWHNIKNL